MWLSIAESLAYIILKLNASSFWKNVKWKKSDQLNLSYRILDWWSLDEFLGSMVIVFMTIIKEAISKKIGRQIQWLILQIISISLFQSNLINLKDVHIFSRLKHSVKLDDLIQSTCSFFNKKTDFVYFFYLANWIHSVLHPFISQHLLNIHHA